jgi:hypothetical protein
VKTRPNDPQALPDPPSTNPEADDLFTHIARQIAVLVVKQHRYRMKQEGGRERKKEG